MTASAPTRALQVTPLTGTIGAQLSGIDLAGDLSDDAIADIRAALLLHRAVFFRDQDLDYEQQVAFARRFGPLTLGHPTIQSPDDKPLMEEVDSATNAPAADWHTDVTFLDQPVSFTFLHGKVMPEVGGDTVWANTVNAYKYYLSPELRAIVDGLRVIHTNAPKDARIDQGHSNPDWEETSRQFVSTIYRSEHSMVTVHPETGERALLLGGFAHRVVGLPPDLSRALLRTLQEYVTRPENTVRWHWEVGDLAIWDNRATQHCAVVDYGRAHRRAERVTVAGAPTVGIDGRASVALKGDASTFYAGT
jgi:taurine dioxygenase